jgi:hypothetical protein
LNYFNAGGNGANYGQVNSYGTFYNNGAGSFTGSISSGTYLYSGSYTQAGTYLQSTAQTYVGTWLGVGGVSTGQTTGNINGTDFYNNGWFRVNNDGTGLYSQYRSHGIQIDGASYGNFDTYGTGQNSWQGMATGGTVFHMASGTVGGIYSTTMSRWITYYDGNQTVQQQNNYHDFGNGSGGVEMRLADISGAAWDLTTYGYQLNFNNGTYGGSYTNRFVMTAAGYFGINQSSPSYMLDVSGNNISQGLANFAITNGTSGAFSSTARFVATGSTSIWGSINYHRAYYTASSFFGGQGFGEITACLSDGSTAGYFNISTNGSGGLGLSGYGNGTLSVTSGRVYSSSDARMKSNINYITDSCTSKIMGLKPATFSYTTDPNVTLKLGFIAQDVEQYIPVAVDGKKYEYMWKTEKLDNGDVVPILDENGNYQYTDEIRPRSLDNTAIIATLVKAFQEQVQIIEDLKQRIQVLEAATKA